MPRHVPPDFGEIGFAGAGFVDELTVTHDGLERESWSRMRSGWTMTTDHLVRTARRLTPHAADGGADIHLGPLCGGSGRGTGRRHRPGRPLEQTEQLFRNEACP